MPRTYGIMFTIVNLLDFINLSGILRKPEIEQINLSGILRKPEIEQIVPPYFDILKRLFHHTVSKYLEW